MGALLDSHTLYWLVSGEMALSDEALIAIGENQAAGTLYVSPITAWELTIAARKPAHKDPPNLGGDTAAKWFRAAVREVEAKIVPISHRIALEASAVIARTGHKDPGDCFLIATARVKRMPIITRDQVLRELAEPDYLDIVAC